MVCNFIGTIPPLRAVDSPRFAARFVSLLPFYHRSDLLGGLSNENFQSPFVTCMCKQGDVVAHSLLLCALLLGLVCCIILLHILWHPGYLPIPYISLLYNHTHNSECPAVLNFSITRVIVLLNRMGTRCVGCVRKHLPSLRYCDREVVLYVM